MYKKKLAQIPNYNRAFKTVSYLHFCEVKKEQSSTGSSLITTKQIVIFHQIKQVYNNAVLYTTLNPNILALH